MNDEFDVATAQELVEEARADSQLLANAIGGWRGALDSAAPTATFLVAFLVTHSDTHSSVVAALAIAGAIAIWRLKQRVSLQQVASGLIGVALSAYLVTRTGKTENFFLIGIVQNSLYASACLISLAVKRPLIGFVIAALAGRDMSWKHDAVAQRRHGAQTWLWLLVFALRLLVTVPLYLAGNTGLLGIAKLVLGWPLYAFAVFLTYRLEKAHT